MAEMQRPVLCRIMLASTQRANVGNLPGWGRGAATVPEILQRISRFNNKHSASVKLLDAQMAEIAANPTGAFPGMNPSRAKALLDMAGISSDYAFEEGKFPTSTAFAYPAAGETLPEEVVVSGLFGEAFVFPTRKYAGKAIALLASGISDEDLVKFGDDVRLNVSEGRLVPFPLFPEMSKIFFPRVGTGQSYAQRLSFPMSQRAFSMIGGSLNSRSGKLIHRRDGAFAGFIVRIGKRQDEPAKNEIHMGISPFEKFNLALVEVPNEDVAKFKENAET